MYFVFNPKNESSYLYLAKIYKIKSVSVNELLKDKNISTHILDSELLLSKSLNKSREEILINLEQNINKKSLTDFNEYLIRRSKKEPIAYILNKKDFWNNSLFVDKNTLVPRPEIYKRLLSFPPPVKPISV